MSAQKTSMDNAQIMCAQYLDAIKSPNEYILFHISEEDPQKWYIIIRNIQGNNGEFNGGEYLFRMIAPNNFPYGPPEFYAMTPNGLYNLEVKVCISIGVYHADQYRAGLGMAGFAEQLMSGLVGWSSMGGGINITKTTAEEKRVMAAASVAHNRRHHAQIIAAVMSSYEEYKKKWVTTPPAAAKPVEKKLSLKERMALKK